MKRGDRPFRLAVAALSLLALIPAGAVGIATASAALGTSTGRDGSVEMTVGASLAPRNLPKPGVTPIRLDVSGEFKDSDRDPYVPPIRELEIESPALEVDTSGIPVCRLRELKEMNTEEAERACGPAIIGAGSVDGGFYFLEQGPVALRSKLLVFNGGTKGARTKIFLHADLTADGFLSAYSSKGPISQVVVATISAEDLAGDGAGTRAVVRIPPILSATGSIIGFHATIARNVAGHHPVGAVCRGARVPIRLRGGFEDGSEVTTALSLPCSASGQPPRSGASS